MSPKVDQISGAVFSVNNTQASNSHSLSTQCICNTSVMSMRDNTYYFIWWPVTCYVKKTSRFLVFHFRGFTLGAIRDIHRVQKKIKPIVFEV